MSMDVKVEEIGPCKRQLSISIPVEHIQEELDKNYLELQENLQLDGFRKGRVPRTLMEKRFGKQMNEDVRQKLMAESVEQALEKESLEAVGLPDFPTVDPEENPFNPSEALEFDVGVEVRPEVSLPGYDGLEVKRRKLAIRDERTDQEIERLRWRYASFDTVAEAVEDEHDVALADYVLSAEDQPIASQEGISLSLRSQGIGGVPVAGLDKLLKGVKVGDVRQADVALPDHFPQEQHRGKKAMVELTIKEVRRATLPEVTDEWTKGVGFQSVDDLRGAIRRSMEAEETQEIERKCREQLFEQLLAAADFPLPEGMVKRETEARQRRRKMALLYAGRSPEQAEAEVEGAEADSRAGALKSCKLHFILRGIAEKEKLFVTEEEVDRQVQALAQRYRKPVDRMKTEMEDDGSLADLRLELRDDKVAEHVLAKATVTEVEPKGKGKADDEQT